MKKLLLIPAMCLLCFGCSSDSKSSKKAESQHHSADWTITSKVKAELLTDTSISAGARFVSVSTENGVVTITGSVSKEDRIKIVKIAKAVQGVKSVNNKMTIAK